MEMGFPRIATSKKCSLLPYLNFHTAQRRIAYHNFVNFTCRGPRKAYSRRVGSVFGVIFLRSNITVPNSQTIIYYLYWQLLLALALKKEPKKKK